MPIRWLDCLWSFNAAISAVPLRPRASSIGKRWAYGLTIDLQGSVYLQTFEQPCKVLSIVSVAAFGQ